MATQKQIDANRRNAKRSTGPRTPRGKYLARLNARKHGLRGHEVLLPDEDSEEFETFRENLFQDLKPVGFLQTQVADQVVFSFWNLRRCERIAAGLLGGGAHVMSDIASKTSDELADLLEPKEKMEDMTSAQLMVQIIIGNVEMYQLKSDDMLENPQNYSADDYTEKPCSDSLIDLCKTMCEQEAQTNPFTYDIALAFRKGLSQSEALLKLTRYETTHRRALQAALQQFYSLQDRRRQPSVAAVNDAD